MPSIDPVQDPQIAAFVRMRDDVRIFAATCVFTQDEADKLKPMKRFPAPDVLPYLYYVMNAMTHETLLAIVKSRRMLITWVCDIVALWDAMFHEGRFIARVSKKEEDADALVRRCKYIYENIDKTTFPVPLPRMEYKYTQLTFPEINSTIKAVPQGADQLRQYTCSRVFADEIAFWPQAEATFTGMRPTLEGGGSVALISTRMPGFFKNLIEDRLDSRDADRGQSLTLSLGDKTVVSDTVEKRYPMEGITQWTNAGNGFTCIDLSYRADPSKRSAQWLAQSRSGIARSQWDREYGDSWVVYDGKPVYLDYDDNDLHILRGDIVVPRRARLLCGFDGGATDVNLAWVLALAPAGENRLVFIDEYFADDGDAENFMQVVAGRLRLEWARLQGFTVHIADQSVFTKERLSQRCLADVMRAHNMYPISGEISFGRRRLAVERLLSKIHRAGTEGKPVPCFQVHERCVTIRAALKGGYHYGRGYVGGTMRFKEVPDKNEYSHIANAVEYVCSRLDIANMEVPYEGRRLPQVALV